MAISHREKLWKITREIYWPKIESFFTLVVTCQPIYRNVGHLIIIGQLLKTSNFWIFWKFLNFSFENFFNKLLNWSNYFCDTFETKKIQSHLNFDKKCQDIIVSIFGLTPHSTIQYITWPTSHVTAKFEISPRRKLRRVLFLMVEK